MQRAALLAAFSCLVTVMPGWAQSQDSRSVPRRDEITIPSEKTLERDT
jgi:hypothetical protein